MLKKKFSIKIQYLQKISVFFLRQILQNIIIIIPIFFILEKNIKN